MPISYHSIHTFFCRLARLTVSWRHATLTVSLRHATLTASLRHATLTACHVTLTVSLRHVTLTVSLRHATLTASWRGGVRVNLPFSCHLNVILIKSWKIVIIILHQEYVF